ncbi:nucleotidyltransferase family protein [Parasphingorhabdus sp.]|uniref:nucleotidyltransferase family protein n=1 Tax=Parasphingorhabdus sp. TaxID=2709688 RepID=UPI0030012891
MNESFGIMLALLAAGQSSRFGDKDKLSALLGDKMLGLYAADAASDLPFARKLVIGSPAHDCAPQWGALGYQMIANEAAAQGQATSVRLAAAQAIASGASALCIMLADMPFVTNGHIGRLIAAFEQEGGTRTIASARHEQPMPPAIFPSGALETLLDLTGDAGARKLLGDALLIAGSDQLLTDIDTPEDLADANRNFKQSK